MKIGFTGTRKGLTILQEKELYLTLRKMRDKYNTFIHGDCVGADEQAHRMALDLGYFIEIYPPKNPKLRAFCRGGFIHEADESKFPIYVCV